MFVDSSAILQTSREDFSRHFDRQQISHRMLNGKGFMYVWMHLYVCRITDTTLNLMQLQKSTLFLRRIKYVWVFDDLLLISQLVMVRLIP